MLSEVSVEVRATGNGVEFRFPGEVSMFMLVVSGNDAVVWELVANEGHEEEMVEGSVSITPLEKATPEMLEMLRRAAENFTALVREGPPLTTPISRVRYGVVPLGYREKAPAKGLIPGRYDLTAMFVQGHASGEFDVPAA